MDFTVAVIIRIDDQNRGTERKKYLQQDSNFGPSDLETSILPLSYEGLLDVGRLF